MLKPEQARAGWAKPPSQRSLFSLQWSIFCKSGAEASLHTHYMQRYPYIHINETIGEWFKGDVAQQKNQQQKNHIESMRWCTRNAKQKNLLLIIKEMKIQVRVHSWRDGIMQFIMYKNNFWKNSFKAQLHSTVIALFLGTVILAQQ